MKNREKKKSNCAQTSTKCQYSTGQYCQTKKKQDSTKWTKPYCAYANRCILFAKKHRNIRPNDFKYCCVQCVCCLLFSCSSLLLVLDWLAEWKIVHRCHCSYCYYLCASSTKCNIHPCIYTHNDVSFIIYSVYHMYRSSWLPYQSFISNARNNHRNDPRHMEHIPRAYLTIT